MVKFSKKLSIRLCKFVFLVYCCISGRNANISLREICLHGIERKLSSSMKFPAAVFITVFASLRFSHPIHCWLNRKTILFLLFVVLSSASRQDSFATAGRTERKRLFSSLDRYFNGEWMDSLRHPRGWKPLRKRAT